VSFQNKFLTSHHAECVGQQVPTGECAEWAGSLVLTDHTSDWAGKQVAVKLQWYMTPSYFFTYSGLEGPDYRKKEEFCCYSGSLVLRNFVRNREGKLLSNTKYDVLKQASEI